ncbi:hypothetical protein [Flavivirga spongiicola]|uniref:DUF4249 domain-containing protein n=1 Tax=Flavivirga spongiicola TaxID=421621 RepID=A0ABU7XTY9_9FLAO|nr:hypothetical protein [Flavivirga sp. MEBiC05379]MDO5978899.1 hypothetical protein [Flavivirga sp. MEBiC05379]
MKSSHIKTLLFALITILYSSCTKEISVDVSHDIQTVIFGELTNLNQPVSISIQQTLPLNSTSSFQAVNDATISLFTKNSNGAVSLITTDFSIDKGVYTSLQPISTTIDNTYWIEVVLNDGTQFKSKEEFMKPVVSITEIEIDEQFNDILNIEFSDPVGITNFYKVKVELFNQGQLVSSNFSESNDVVFDGNADASLGVDLFRDLDDDQPLPLYDAIKASLGNINFSSYQFLLNQRSQIEANEDSGEDSGGDPSQLFSTPPVSLLGNITNISNNKTTLGNFTVISLSVDNK